jgi:hypothetical protein
VYHIGLYIIDRYFTICYFCNPYFGCGGLDLEVPEERGCKDAARLLDSSYLVPKLAHFSNHHPLWTANV